MFSCVVLMEGKVFIQFQVFSSLQQIVIIFHPVYDCTGMRFHLNVAKASFKFSFEMYDSGRLLLGSYRILSG